MSTRSISEEEKENKHVAPECYCIDALSLHNRGRFLVLRKPLFFNVGIVPASFSGASFFAWQRRARNTSDWWWTARDYGKGTDGGRSACQILCSFLCKKTASSHTGCGQAILFSNLATWTGLNSFLKISNSSAIKLPAILKARSARRLARCLLPAFLCAHIERETDVWVVGRVLFSAFSVCCKTSFGDCTVRQDSHGTVPVENSYV